MVLEIWLNLSNNYGYNTLISYILAVIDELYEHLNNAYMIL